MRHLTRLIIAAATVGAALPIDVMAQTQEEKCREALAANPFDPYCVGYLEGLTDGRAVNPSITTVGSVGTFIGTPENGVLIGNSNRVTLIQSAESLGLKPDPVLSQVVDKAFRAKGLDPNAYKLTFQRDGELKASIAPD